MVEESVRATRARACPDGLGQLSSRLKFAFSFRDLVCRAGCSNKVYSRGNRSMNEEVKNDRALFANRRGLSCCRHVTKMERALMSLRWVIFSIMGLGLNLQWALQGFHVAHGRFVSLRVGLALC